MPKLLYKLFYHMSLITQYSNYLELQASSNKRIISQVFRGLE